MFGALPAIRSAGGVGVWDGTLDNLNPAFIAAQMGVPEPDLMWLFPDASGAVEIVSDAGDFVDSGAVLKQQSSTLLSGTVSEFDDPPMSMDQTDTSVADVASETVTMLWIGTQLSGGGTGNGIVAKRSALGADPGYGFYNSNTTNGYVAWFIDSGGAFTQRTISTNHFGTALVCLMTREWDANIQSIWTAQGSSVGTRVQATISSLDMPLGMGGGGGFANASDGEHGCLAFWFGTNGDGMGEAERLLMAQGLGYEP